VASLEAASLPKIESELKKLAKQNRAELSLIDPAEIEVRNWVRWKCQFGCKGFAKHLSCPPYVPGPSETRALLQEYEHAYIVHFVGIPGMHDINPADIPENWHPFLRELILWIAETMYSLEQHAFYRGYYKALAFAAYPCAFCEDCVAEQSTGVVDRSLKRDCRHAERVRTSMEAVGIDVFATVSKMRLPIDVIPCEGNVYGKIQHTDINSYGLLLLD
jgi:predicted metal-binding protein